VAPRSIELHDVARTPAESGPALRGRVGFVFSKNPGEWVTRVCCRRGRTHDGLAAQPPARVGVPRRRWRGRPEARWAPVLGSRSSPAFVVLVGGSGFWHERSRHQSHLAASGTQV
jgi:hypothetical protein